MSKVHSINIPSKCLVLLRRRAFSWIIYSRLSLCTTWLTFLQTYIQHEELSQYLVLQIFLKTNMYTHAIQLKTVTLYSRSRLTSSISIYGIYDWRQPKHNFLMMKNPQLSRKIENGGKVRRKIIIKIKLDILYTLCTRLYLLQNASSKTKKCSHLPQKYDWNLDILYVLYVCCKMLYVNRCSHFLQKNTKSWKHTAINYIYICICVYIYIYIYLYIYAYTCIFRL